MSPIKNSRRRWLLPAIAVLVLSTGLWIFHLTPEISWETWIRSLPAAKFIAALVVLPVAGFPVSLLHLATGARFGIGGGILAVTASTAVHLLVSFLVARHLQDATRRALAWFGWHARPVPPSAAWPFAVWIALIPGVSYALKNFIPPLAGVKLRTIFLTLFPLHVVRSIVGLTLGRAAIEASWELALFAVPYTIGLLALTRVLARRYQSAAQERTDEPAASTIRDAA